MRSVLILLSALTLACGGGGGGGGSPAAPTLVFLTPAVDTLRTIGPAGAVLRIAYEDDAAVAAATTSLYAELDGVRVAIAENRPHGSGAPQEIEWELSGLPEGVYTITGEIDDGVNPAVVRVAAGNLFVTVERSLAVASLGYDAAIGVTAFDDGSYAVVGRMTLPHYQFRGSNMTVLFGAGEPNETSFTSKIGQGFVARYEWNGALRWVRRTYGSGGDFVAYLTSVAPMPDGGVVAKGEHVFDVTVGKNEPNETKLVKESGLDARMAARYGNDGELLWAITMRGEGGGNGGIVADESGSIFLADTFRGGMTLQGFSEPGFGERDPVVARLDANGNAQWLRRFGSSREDSLNDIALAGHGGVLICGSHGLQIAFDTSVLPGSGGYVAKIDGNGHTDWALNLVSTNAVNPIVDVQGVAAAPDGSIYATGTFSGTPAFGAAETWDDRGPTAQDGAFVVRLGENGSVLWLRMFAGGGNDVCVHQDGSATVLSSAFGTVKAGDFTSTGPGSSDRYFLRLAADGTVLGLRVEGTADLEHPMDIAAFPDRSTVAVGSSNPLSGFNVSRGVISRTAER